MISARAAPIRMKTDCRGVKIDRIQNDIVIRRTWNDRKKSALQYDKFDQRSVMWSNEARGDGPHLLPASNLIDVAGWQSSLGNSKQAIVAWYGNVVCFIWMKTWCLNLRFYRADGMP